MPQTEKEKMLAGELYNPYMPELGAMSKNARRLTSHYNQTAVEADDERIAILRELLGGLGSKTEIRPPFYCDYGTYIFVGDGVFMNFGCVILDCNTVRIGNNVLIGPNVQIYTPHHPVDAATRLTGLEQAFPVTIGNNVWIGGAAIICPGVTIGDNTVIGAGSVVTKDIPANVVAVGNPCRVIRQV